MCFEADSVPPIPPIEGASVRHHDLVLEAADGNRFAAFEAFADHGRGPAVVVLPDVRGLYGFYEELALRFAEAGYDALAIDYFGRTAGVAKRDADFPFPEHVEQTTYSGMCADVAAAVAHVRKDQPDRAVFTLGFCYGGSNSWHQAATGLGLAGVVGFYGHPDREKPTGSPHVIARVASFACPVLGLMGGDDPMIPTDLVDAFESALAANGIDHEIVTYPGAPHSFFDRKYEEFATESADAWSRVLAFLERNS